jgi:predicted MFS family arabinose efflux permease
MRENKGILIILGAAHSLNHSLFLVLPPLLENVAIDLNASFQTLGIIATLSFLIYGVGALVGGPLSDYIGGIKLIKISIALSGASTFLFVISKNLYVFGLGMFIMSFWASFYHPTSNNVIWTGFIENTAGAMGIHGAAGTVGQMFTPTVAYVLGTRIGWRFAFVFFGVLSIITAFVIRSNLPSRRIPGERVSLFEFLKIPNLWVLLIFNVIVGLFFRGIELFFPAFLSIDRGFSGHLAAISNSLVLSFGVIGQLIGGKTSDTYGPIKVLLASSIGVLSGFIFLLLFPINIIGVALFIVIYGVAYFSHQPAMTALIGDISPKNTTGMAYGVMFFFSFGLGSASTAIAGYLADTFNLEIAFWFMALLSAMALIVSIIILKSLKR